MTAAFSFPFSLLFSLPKLKETSDETRRPDPRCREHLIRLVSSEACTSEYGAQALMNLYPREF